MSPTVSVIIPSWNGAAHLPTCLDALSDQSFQDFEIVVVDNGSTDQTSLILNRYPELRVVHLPVNRGFAAGANVGLRAAKGNILVLLNNDTRVADGWLAALVQALEADPSAGMATSKIRLFADPDRLHTTGDTVDLAGMAANRGFGERDFGQYDSDRDVFGASAAAAAYRRAMLDDVGLFEEAYGSYFEDVDLNWRARLAGWTCTFAPEAMVYHHVSATGGGAYASYHVARNRVWTIARCYPGRLLLANLDVVVRAQFHVATAAIAGWRGAAARATLRGQVVGLLTWPRWLAARKRIQRARRVELKELDRLLTA